MRVSFKTFGCRLNQAETAKYEALFQLNGVSVVAFGGACDIFVIHSCSVTQRAETECLKAVRAIKHGNPAACVVLAGCAVESAAVPQLRNLGIDLIIPREQKEHLVEMVLTHLKLTCRASAPPPSPAFTTHRALLKIQDGCNFFCSYCIIPHNRGAPVSRDLDECLSEARVFIERGFQEIVITGCNIACYSHQGAGLPELVRRIAALPGLGRVRLGSVEPGTVAQDLARLMAESERICRFLHLPVQHGDNGILQRMNRRYTTEQIAGELDGILKIVPDLALGSDFITGFPGEDESAFRNTRTLIEQYPFSNLHVFPYSERRGTAAAEFPERIVPGLRRQRAKELIAIGRTRRLQYARTWINRTVEMLIENFDCQGHACGWSGEYVGCRLQAIPPEQQAEFSGRIVSFTPETLEDDLLTGQLPLPLPLSFA